MTPNDKIRSLVDAHPQSGQKIVAIDLGVSPSTVNRWYQDQSVPEGDNLNKINVLHSGIGAELHGIGAELHGIGAELHGIDAGLHGIDAGPLDAPTIPDDLERLEAAVLDASISDVYEVAVDDPPPPPPPPVQVKSASDLDLFVKMFWVPGHQFAGGFFKDTAAATAVVEHCQTEIDIAACGAVNRSAERLGIVDFLDEGHWIGDLIIIGMYARSVVQVAQAAKSDDKPSDPGDGGDTDQEAAA